jgi:hypothetical protein
MFAAILPTLLATASGDTDRVEFARDVRPILSQNCYACHGPMASSPTAAQALELARLDETIALEERVLSEASVPTDELASWSALQREQLARLAELDLGRWHALGPFLAASQAEAFRARHGPEEGVDLGAEVGGFAWSERPALAGRDVRFVQLFHRGWDGHNNLPREIRRQCKDTDQACTAPVRDLKRRGLLEDTLVICGGEFGCTIYSQGSLTADNHGRDHHGRGFHTWFAGAGVKASFEYGETDDHRYSIVRDPVHIRDLNATILHLLGVDHARFTYPFQGLDQNITGVEGEARVVQETLT